MDYDEADLDRARMMARKVDLIDTTRERYKDKPEQLVADSRALLEGLTQVPRCHCGRRLIHTFGGYKCLVHGYV